MTYEDYPIKSYEKHRYADTDIVGHINNSVFSTCFETGRVELLDHLLVQGAFWVIAKISIEYRKEITYPGTVEIGTQIEKIGTSSVRLSQQLFQNGVAVAQADSAIVQIDAESRKSTPLSETALIALAKAKET